MADREKDQEAQTRSESEEKELRERPKVKLPLVPTVPGNAWSQMRAREQEHIRERELYKLEFGELGYDPNTVITRPTASYSSSRPSTMRKSSGLDYDEALALPMPKPRLMAVSSSAPALEPTVSKPNVLTKLGGLKRQGATEPHPGDKGAGTKVEGEKKKSMIATLRSKLSFKELGKEFRKAQDPPHSAMPQLPPSIGFPQVEKTKQSPPGSFDFDEERLYVPKPRDPEVHPASAPVQTTRFSDSGSFESSPQSATSCPAQQTKGDDGLDAETLKDKEEQHRPHHKVGNVEPMTRLDTVLIDGSSPPASTGDTSRGHPAVVDAERRYISMNVENEPSVPSQPKIDATSTDSPASYKPSTSNAPEGIAPVSSSCERKQSTMEKNRPLVVSSDQQRPLSVKIQDQTEGTTPSGQNSRRSSTRSREHMASSPGQAEPDFDPTHMRMSFDSQLPMDDPRFYSGVTTHGGYAPPPPHPGYQNTVTLEQQISTYMDSLHIHVDGTANKLARSFENTNNWSTDQILRHTGHLSDLMRKLNNRVMSDTEVTRELQRVTMEVKIQVGAIQREQRHMEDRMTQLFQSEYNKLKGEINALASTVRSNLPHNPAQDARFMNTRLQGSPDFTKGSKDNERPQQFRKMKSRQMRREDVVTKKTESRGGEEHNCESVALNKHAEEHTLTDDVPTPMAAFPTPSSHGDDWKNHFTESHPRRLILKDPSKISIGSPEPLLSSSTKGKERATSSQTLVHKASAEIMKFPAKMGLFYPFRRGRDRRSSESKTASHSLPPTKRSEDDKTSEERESRKQEPLPFTPPMQTSAIASTAAEHRQVEVSPSRVHPALRNPAQQQIMAERERLNSQDTMTPRQLLRSSRSFQDLTSRSRNAASFDWIDSSTESPSKSTSRRQNQQDLAMGFPALSTASRHPSSTKDSSLTAFAEARMSQASDVSFSYRGPTPPPRESEASEPSLPIWYQAAYAYKSIEKPEDD
ncbi:hypothetical protein ANOM_001899 [Aspergillus nomiae NRRL 13137]|uniref:Uncharacterized protein n=1 Tax=Aspergillus nomiae NRRL (strain ATCC 15546 / NRRL 13137 / CBS 260.88 / M93) TaxID=1509407 RepID=A0A0L1JDQ8_ASPN3|nr:uncharacterized protein ANOM_001899 [Aspergillus nomiae NRRL 13137]KNG89543.1 hypothetical protein ANOM_001899 [Aspergillus nomiae NRRL 13137]